LVSWRKWSLPLSIFALLACGAPPPDAEEFDRQAIEAEIAAFAGAFWGAWRDGNAGLERAMALFDDHPDFTYAAQGAVWLSVPDVAETFRSAFQVVQSQTIEIQQTSITVVSRDFAHITQSGAYSMTDLDGVSTEMTPFAFSGLLARTSSGWRVRSAHVSEPCVQ
jgi:hypothetical protein